ncbi:MAG: hypothetical protein H6597_02355 [Flavobacteriales bacterium]|nr:hypothetical protein [Flavobacteriales bacterium]MCB9193349.1 hypothetical protein [Flavobacteriales bacterium]
MKYAADTPDAYLEQVPDERKPALRKLRSTINKNLPKGFAEAMSHGMIGWVDRSCLTSFGGIRGSGPR